MTLGFPLHLLNYGAPLWNARPEPTIMTSNYLLMMAFDTAKFFFFFLVESESETKCSTPKNVEAFFSTRCFSWGHPGGSDLHHSQPPKTCTNWTAKPRNPWGLGCGRVQWRASLCLSCHAPGLRWGFAQEGLPELFVGEPHQGGGDGSPISRNSWGWGKECNNCNNLFRMKREYDGWSGWINSSHIDD